MVPSGFSCTLFPIFHSHILFSFQQLHICINFDFNLFSLSVVAVPHMNCLVANKLQLPDTDIQTELRVKQCLVETL
jgi:hypothetical protein